MSINKLKLKSYTYVIILLFVRSIDYRIFKVYNNHSVATTQTIITDHTVGGGDVATPTTSLYFYAPEWRWDLECWTFFIRKIKSGKRLKNSRLNSDQRLEHSGLNYRTILKLGFFFFWEGGFFGRILLECTMDGSSSPKILRDGDKKKNDLIRFIGASQYSRTLKAKGRYNSEGIYNV